MLVEEVMTDRLLAVPLDLVVSEALAIAHAAGLHHLLLTERGKLKGMACICELEARPAWEPLSRESRRKLHTVEAESPLELAAKRFVDAEVGCLAVLDGVELVGVLTRGDLRRAALPPGSLPLTLYCSYCGDTRHVREMPGQPGMAACLECQQRADPSGPYEEGTTD